MSGVGSKRQSGVVKFFNTTSGYGFIIPDDGGKDVFIHQSDLTKSEKKTVEQHDHVTFEVVSTPRGPKAIKVDDY